MKIREFSYKELKILKKALKAIGATKLDFILRIKENKQKEIVALNKDLLKFIENHKNLNYVFVGIKMGEIGKRLRLTLEGAFLLHKKNKKKVYVNKNGEMLFLYGRDIFRESLEKVSPDIKENDIVVVCNLKEEVLGIGRTRFDCKRIMRVEKDRIVVDNLVDRGEYLRKNKLYNAY